MDKCDGSDLESSSGFSFNAIERLSDADIDNIFGISAPSLTDNVSLIDLARTYGLNNFDPMPLRYRDIAEVVRCLKLDRRSTIYDVGCGSGRVVLYVNSVVEAAIFGVEIVSERCQALEAIVARRALRGVSIVRGDALRMSFVDAAVMFVNNPFFSAATDQFLDRMAGGGIGPETRVVAFHSIVGRLRQHPKFAEIAIGSNLPAYRFGVFKLRSFHRADGECTKG